MTLALKALVALSEDRDLVPGVYMAAYNHL